jgi:DNA-binding transcriptional ArsR family regulator
MNSKYKNFNHKQIDSLIHNRLRLAILSAVAHSDEVDFMSLKNAVKTSDGNLSIQLKKLEEAGFLTINKSRQSKRTQTNMALTNKGFTALQSYRELISSWLDV